MLNKIIILSLFVGAVTLLSGCSSETITSKSPAAIQGSEIEEVDRDDDIVLPSREDSGATQDIFAGSESISLKDVSGGSATGQAWLVVDADANVTSHRIAAKNLPKPLNGDFYEGWIVSSAVAPGGVISTGVMAQQEDGTWLLQYGIDQALPEHKTVVLTLEPDDGDPAPAVHILEGAFE